MSVLMVLWAICGVASWHKDTGLGGAVYDVLAPVQTALGLWQTWGMFAPPPSHTKYLAVVGTTPDGTEIEQPPLFAPLGDSFFRWRYERLNKVAMIAAKTKSVSTREAVAMWTCRQSRAAGVPLVEVRVFKETARTPRPKKARSPDYQGLSFKRVEMGTWPCPD
jgi:hypothetical protein